MPKKRGRRKVKADQEVGEAGAAAAAGEQPKEEGKGGKKKGAAGGTPGAKAVTALAGGCSMGRVE